jgi:hypothetical protein
MLCCTTKLTPLTEFIIEMKNGVFWVLTRATRRNNPEDTILHSHRRENLKSYIIIEMFETENAALFTELPRTGTRFI